MRWIILFTIVLIKLSFIQSQNNYKDGWVIDNLGDTLKGQIVYPSSGKGAEKCNFKTSSGTKYSYSPSQIKSYKVGDAFYISGKFQYEINFEEFPFFIEILIEGPAKLVRIKDRLALIEEGSVSWIDLSESRSFEANSGKVVVKKEALLSLARKLGVKCPAVSLLSGRSGKIPDEKDIYKYVETYNSCLIQPGESITTYRRPHPGLVIKSGVSVGLGFVDSGFSGPRSTFSSREIALSNFQFQSILPGCAISLRGVPSFEGTGRIGGTIEIALQKKKFTQVGMAQVNDTRSERYKMDVESIDLAIPMGLSYFLKKGRESLFIEIGFIANLPMNKKSYLFVDDFVVKDDQYYVFLNKLNFPFQLKSSAWVPFCSLGYITNKIKHFNPFIELKFFSGQGYFSKSNASPERNVVKGAVMNLGVNF